MGQNRLYEGRHNWKHLGRNQDTNGDKLTNDDRKNRKTKYGQGNTRQRETDCDSRTVQFSFASKADCHLTSEFISALVFLKQYCFPSFSFMIHTGCAGDESFQLFNLNVMELICQSFIQYESGISTGCWRMGLMRVAGWANGNSDIV